MSEKAAGKTSWLTFVFWNLNSKRRNPSENDTGNQLPKCEFFHLLQHLPPMGHLAMDMKSRNYNGINVKLEFAEISFRCKKTHFTTQSGKPMSLRSRKKLAVACTNNKLFLFRSASRATKIYNCLSIFFIVTSESYPAPETVFPDPGVRQTGACPR